MTHPPSSNDSIPHYHIIIFAAGILPSQGGLSGDDADVIDVMLSTRAVDQLKCNG